MSGARVRKDLPSLSLALVRPAISIYEDNMKFRIFVGEGTNFENIHCITYGLFELCIFSQIKNSTFQSSIFCHI